VPPLVLLIATAPPASLLPFTTIATRAVAAGGGLDGDVSAAIERGVDFGIAERGRRGGGEQPAQEAACGAVGNRYVGRVEQPPATEILRRGRIHADTRNIQ
jgi:hypothetical protein